MSDPTAAPRSTESENPPSESETTVSDSQEAGVEDTASVMASVEKAPVTTEAQGSADAPEAKADEPDEEAPAAETSEAEKPEGEAEETTAPEAEAAPEEPPSSPDEAEVAAETEASEEPKVAAAEAQPEEAKADEAKADEAKADEAKAEEAKAPEAKADEPKADEPKANDGAAPAAEENPEMLPLIAAMEAKETVEGRIIGWNKGGYHVAVGKIAAFCPVSQIEIGNPRSPKKYVDKTFAFRIIEIQKDGRRVVLSRSAALKAERQARAAKVKETLKVGAILEGRVSSVTDFGAFVDLGGGIEGLVHISEISRQRVEHAKEKVQTGQTVKVAVIKIEKGGKRISLSMKQLEDDPWDGIQERFTPGNEFTGTVVRKTEFGLFVEVEPGVEGLVHKSRLPLGQSLESDLLEDGKEVQGWVHEVDRKRRRLSLSLRPVAEGNPWKDVRDRYPEGEVVSGMVERLANFGAFIELEPGLTGLLPFSVLGEGMTNPKRQFQVGKQVKVKVLAIDRDKRRISLGTESSKAEGSVQDYKEYMKSQSGGSSTEPGMNALAAAFAKVKGQINP